MNNQPRTILDALSPINSGATMNQVNPTQMDQMQKAIDIVSNVQARGVSPDQVMNVIASQNPEVANMMQFVINLEIQSRLYMSLHVKGV
jgi:hypothetical protein